MICLDGNISAPTINYVCSFAKEHGIPVLFEPTDPCNARKPFETDGWKALAYTTPNLMELQAMNRALGLPVTAELPRELDGVIDAALEMSRPLLKHLQCVIVSLGREGVLLCSTSEDGEICLQPRKDPQTSAGQLCAIHYPAIAVRAEEVLNVSGAGDCLTAGIIAGLLSGQETNTCVRMGLLAASYSVRSQEAISTSISADSVNPQRVLENTWLQPQYHAPTSRGA